MSECWVPTMDVRPVRGSVSSAASSSSTGTILGPDGTLLHGSFGTGRKVTMLVDSRDRDYATNPNASSFVIKLPETLHNVTNAVLISAELPTTYHVFSAARGNTSLRLIIDGVTRDLTIPDGNYTPSSLAAALQAAIVAADYTTDNISVTVGTASSKCTIEATTEPTSQIIVDCTSGVLGNSKPTNWGLAYYLGFTRDQQNVGVGSVTGSRVVTVDPEAYVLVDIDELNGVSETAMYADGGTRGAFAKIPLTQKNFGQYSVYDKTLVCNELRPPRARLDRLSINLRYHDGTLMNLNGAEWSATVELTCTLTRT